MKCVYCSRNTQVTNSRHQKKTNSTWRRRQCLACQAIFTTVENTDLEKSIVVNINGALKPFLRDKLFVSVYNSLKHRKTALGDATALTDTVIGLILKNVDAGVVEPATIANCCSQVLKRFDKTAVVYYAAYHPTSVKS